VTSEAVRASNSAVQTGRPAARWAGLAVAVLLLLVLPWFFKGFMQTLMAKFLIFSMFAMSYNLVFGYGGLLSLGHAAYFGIGAYTAGLLMLHGGVTSFWIAAPLALIFSLVGGVFLGFLSLRVTGLYFLLITFGLGQLLLSLAWNIRWFNSSGMQGISAIPYPDMGIPGFQWTNRSFYYFVFLWFVVCYFLVNRVADSPFGRGLVGVREGQDRMRALGYNVWLFRYLILIVAGVLAGWAGMLYAYSNSFVQPAYFGFDYSWLPMLMVIVGGAATRIGPMVGALIVVFADYYVSQLTPIWWPFFLGWMFVFIIMFFRGGIVVFAGRLWHRMGGR
jgi:branched-chain amino acid transport system permease protein